MQSGKSGNNRHANKILLLSVLAGTFPLLLIYCLYLINPDSPFLNYIFNSTLDIPSVTSSFSPVMTRVMDMYSKNEPFFAILIFLFLFRNRKTGTVTDKEKLITACIFSPFIYAFYVYYFLWNNFELTTAGRPVRLLAENNLGLLFFYICLYYASLLLTYIMCYQPVLVYRLWKERQSQ
ncbi:colicin immunity protein Cui [Salmonella enterica subsp. enterica serovar Eastbourne]|nr:colicin immunity protein Cui [Salmonella enterica subsp. enterica serovar Eastbourne]